MLIGSIGACGGEEEKGTCTSAWTDFSVPGDPEAGAEQSSWNKAAVVSIEAEQRGLQQQAGFTDPQGDFRESNPFASPDESLIGFKIGFGALRGSIRVIAEEGDDMCGEVLDLSIEETTVDDPLFRESIQPTEWHKANR